VIEYGVVEDAGSLADGIVEDVFEDVGLED